MPDHLKNLVMGGSRCVLARNSAKHGRVQCRRMATETTLPYSERDHDARGVPTNEPPSPPTTFGPIGPQSVLTTVYHFPTMEPLRFASYPANHLYLPLRRDILHRAVVYEGDKTRQGTASTKWRDEVHGSGRKIRPQKGTGRARLGDKKSPMLRGGGVAFGPKPRDFSTELPRKIYDLAWRTALSYRYRRGQLIIVDEIEDLQKTSPTLTKEIFEVNGWGRDHGRSLIVTESIRKNLFQGLSLVGEQGRALERWDVDVKDLLEQGRIIVEKPVLDKILAEHQSDLVGIRRVVSPTINE